MLSLDELVDRLLVELTVSEAIVEYLYAHLAMISQVSQLYLIITHRLLGLRSVAL